MKSKICIGIGLVWSFFLTCLLQAQPIKVAVIGSITGTAAPVNEAMFAGARFALEEINKQGGLLGQPVEILEIDNFSHSIGSKQAAQIAVEKEVTAVIGPMFSSHAIATAAVLQKAKIPMITPSGTNPKITETGDYIFRASYTDHSQGTILAQFAREELQAKTVVIFTEVSSTYSVGLSKFFKDAFIASQGQLLWDGNYLQEAKDYKKIIQKTIELQPDVVFIPGYQREVSLILKQAIQLGLSAYFLGGDGWTDKIYEYAGPKLAGRGYYSKHWHRLSPNPISQKFLANYEAKHGKTTKDVIPLTYDAVMLLASAIKQANSTERSKIRDALAATLNFQGVTGTISFGPERNPIKPVAILKFENGRSVFHQLVTP